MSKKRQRGVQARVNRRRRMIDRRLVRKFVRTLQETVRAEMTSA